MRTLTAAAEFRERMGTLTVILAPTDDIEGRMRARLALDALFMASARDHQLGGSDRERMDVAVSVAMRLVASLAVGATSPDAASSDATGSDATGSARPRPRGQVTASEDADGS